MSEVKSLESLGTCQPTKLEERVRENAAELELLLDRAPKQQCRVENAWNENDDFIDRFNDIWGEVVG